MLLAALLVSPGVAQQLQFQGPPKPPPGRSATPVGSLSGSELLAGLRKGGYVIYFRHTSTDFSRDDSQRAKRRSYGRWARISKSSRGSAPETGQRSRRKDSAMNSGAQRHDPGQYSDPAR